MTKNVNTRKWAWTVAAIVCALAIGTPGTAQAQPDFNAQTGCLPGMDPSIQIGPGFCTPVWKLPLGFPELALGVGSGTVHYDSATTVLTVIGDYGDAYYLRTGVGNQYGLPIHFEVRVKIGNDGTFISGAGGACGAGTLDDYCVTGLLTDPTYGPLGVTGPIIKGRVEHAANMKDAITHSGALHDDFEFYINVTSAQNGDNLYAKYMWPNMFTHVAFEAFGYNGGTVPYVNGNPYGASFTEFFQFGYSGITLQEVGFLFDPQNGRVAGRVTDALNPSTGIGDAGVQLSGPVNALLDVAADGSYTSLGNLPQGDYTLTVLPPAGYSVYGPSVLNVHIGLNGAGNDVITNLNFSLLSTPLSASAFTTFSQASWGVKPKGNNAGMLLAKYFDFMYPDKDGDGDTELVIGGNYTITESSPAAIMDFLPQEGRPVALTSSYVDPPSKYKAKHAGKFGHHRKLGSLAGETLALELNVRISANAISKSGLGALHVASGRLAGMTVAQVLALGNRALGGESFATVAAGTTLRSYDDLEDIIERINKNFQAGTTNNGYLIP
jgi:hypothetical protein